jgi:intracellular septation protein
VWKRAANNVVRTSAMYSPTARSPPDCAFASTPPRLCWTKTNLSRLHHEPAIAMKLLFDLFPVFLFFVAFKFQGIYVATAVAIVATIAQIIWTKFRHGKVDMMLWVSFAIVGIFGGATLLLHDESFIKWKPTVLYWIFSVILLFSNLLFHKNLMHNLLHEKIALPLHAWNRLNLSWSLFFAVLGFINLYVAFNYSTDNWVNFKLFGVTGMMLVFILVQGVWLSKYVDEKKEHN